MVGGAYPTFKNLDFSISQHSRRRDALRFGLRRSEIPALDTVVPIGPSDRGEACMRLKRETGLKKGNQ